MRINLKRSNVTTIIFTTALFAAIHLGFAQEEIAKDVLNTTTTQTMGYVDANGTSVPYTVTIQENRVYTSEFEQSEANPENFNRKNTPSLVSKMITVSSESDSSLNMVIVLRYKKGLADDFELTSTDKGFTVDVDGKKMNYIFGKGAYFTNTDDKNFFSVSEFDSRM